MKNEYTGLGTMKVLALLCIDAAIFTSSLDKSANIDVSQYDFSDFLVLPLFLPFKGVGVVWLRRPCEQQVSVHTSRTPSLKLGA